MSLKKDDLIVNTFSLAGLIGFARLCPGDQYEVSRPQIPFENLLLRH